MNKNNHIKITPIFILTCSVLFFSPLFFIRLVINPYGEQRGVCSNDLFADFFKVLHYIAGCDTYFNIINGLGEKICLPILYLLLYSFSKLGKSGSISLQKAQISHKDNLTDKEILCLKT
jgi:hypothetical protein